jgi:hypothetical protein
MNSTIEKNNHSERSSTTLVVLSVAVVIAGGAAVTRALAAQALAAEHLWLMMIGLALLVAPMSTVQIPGVKAKVVLGDIVTFSCAILFGPGAAIIAAVADGALASTRLTKDPKKFLYNVATCAVSMAAANFATASAFPQFGTKGAQISPTLVGAAGVFTFAYFIISTFLIASHVAFSKGLPLVKLWKDKFLWTLMSYVASGLSAIAAFVLARQVGHYVFLILCAVMVLVFLGYREYFRKFEGKAAAASA